eukprot:s11917_g1.t1
MGAMSKRPLRQAPALPVDAVRLIEDYVHEEPDQGRAAIGGFILFLYSSSRWSDAARGSDLRVDTAGNGLVLLECSTKHYKTKAKDRKDAQSFPSLLWDLPLGVVPGSGRGYWLGFRTVRA